MDLAPNSKMRTLQIYASLQCAVKCYCFVTCDSMICHCEASIGFAMTIIN